MIRGDREVLVSRGWDFEVLNILVRLSIKNLDIFYSIFNLIGLNREWIVIEFLWWFSIMLSFWRTIRFNLNGLGLIVF